MSHHPCAGHACDHCYTCDVLGICCSTGRVATARVAEMPDDDLIEAFERDAHVGHPLLRAAALDRLKGVVTDQQAPDLPPLLRALAQDEAKRANTAQPALPASTAPDLSISNTTTPTKEETTHVHR